MSIGNLCKSCGWSCLCLWAAIVLAGVSHGAPAAKEPAKPVPKDATMAGTETAAPPPVVKPTAPAKPGKPAAPKAEKPAAADPSKPADPEKSEAAPQSPPAEPAAMDPDDHAAVENAEAESAAVAKPVSPDPVRIYGWREYIFINGVEEKLKAKLDTGALTSSIHAEEKELFERDGKKWVRFIVTDPGLKKPARTRIEAPLVRMARIKEPGAESEAREVVRLGFRIGERKMRGEFTLNNRSNMLAPVLIGRTLIKDLGMVDPGRTHLAEQKIFR